MDQSIVSFVNDSSEAIDDRNNRFPDFGKGSDLCFGSNSENMRPRARKSTYQLPIRHSILNFEWADWEVFSVS